MLSEAKDQRSEASADPLSQTLRCAQGDNPGQQIGPSLPLRSGLRLTQGENEIIERP
jgi:hypothetical protein